MANNQTISSSIFRRLRPFLRLCADQSAISVGKQLHALILTTRVAESPEDSLLNAFLHFYAACGDTSYARKVFDEIPQSKRDARDGTALMSSFTRHNLAVESLRFFSRMVEQRVEIDEVAMVCLFSACAQLQDDCMGSQGHGCVIKVGLERSVKLCNALMDMYGKCGMISELKQIFTEMNEKNVISWTVVLDATVKCEGVEEGKVVFDGMPERNEVAWTIIIAGYVGSGFGKEGFRLLHEMLSNCGVRLNIATLSSFLSASAQSGYVIMGKWVHVYCLKTMGMEMGVMVGTALLDMYAKCGKIDTAIQVFNSMPVKNVVTWNALFNGLAMHGQGRILLDMFPTMIEQVNPDDLTFMAVLSACSHSGLVNQGRYYFNTLESVYGITPKPEHYACMVDLLGRAGCFEEAESLIKKMPVPPNEFVLGSLLGSCSVHGQLELGEKVIQQLIQMDPRNIGYKILLSNMYSLAGKHDKAISLRNTLKTSGIKKIPGVSSIHVGGKVHQFIAGDKSHPRTQEIYLMLDDMVQRLRLAGYSPNTMSRVFVGADGVEESIGQVEEKELALFSHSEKLAVCFGLISTRAGTPLYIFKNLRICLDCHLALKLVSRIYKREITVRDRNRFHHFREGSCSCSDFW